MRLKITIVIIIIAALLASGYFIRDYLNQSAAADTLNAQLAATNLKIQQLTASSQTMTLQAGKTKASQAAVQASIATESLSVPTKVNTNIIVRDVLDTGEINQVTVIPLSTSDWARVKILQGDYWLFTMSLSLTGREQGLVYFINDMRSLYPTMIINGLSISGPGPDAIKASMSIGIYGR